MTWKPEIDELERRPALPALIAYMSARTGICFLSAALFATGGAWGQEAARPGETRVVRAYFDDPAVAARAVISLEALESEYEKGYIVVRATDADIEAMRRAGMRVVEDDSFVSVSLPAELPAPERPGTIPSFPCYRTVEETYASAKAIVDAYPRLATWRRVGQSWKRRQDPSDGYDLMVLRLTNSRTTQTKPALLITTALHAREYATAELGLRFAEHLADSYETDADVRWLLDHQEVHIMLQANPDGRKRAEEWRLWRKNHNTNHCPSQDLNDGLTGPGVDLNRNFDFKFGYPGGSSDQECDQTFRGPSAASEPETQAISKYMSDLFPDARGPGDRDAAPADTGGVYLDIHSHGRLLLWPWGHVDEVAANGRALQTFGRKLAFFNGYLPIQGIGLYPVSGSTFDYSYGVLGRSSFTYELGTWFFEDCDYFESSILDQNLGSLLYAFKAARTPYLTPAGPDALDPELSRGASTTGVAAGTRVTLTATFDDTRYENQNGAEPTQAIAAAEYYVDAPPWLEDATAKAMFPTDAAFDSSSEDATATIDTTGLPPGRHIVFVRARDRGGNWGVVSAVFLFVGSAPPSAPNAPTIETGDRQLHLNWTAPPNNGSPITRYVVRYKPVSSYRWSLVGVGNHTNHAITGLSNDAPYDVQVRAVNAVGGSPWSEPSTGTPAADAGDDPGGGDEICTADEHTLCLQGSRYRVQSTWWTPDGASGVAGAAEHATDDSGLFWFFGPDNWEVLIKVLDGCAINGNVWVFGTSTTDLRHVIRVTDTVTGAAKEYRNEPGVPAPAITDAEAFPQGCRP